jgi:DHA1 family multidrug resistance protein-like MFS transporter
MAGPWRRTFLTLCAAQAMAMLAFGMALPFLPLYIQELGIADPRDAARWAGVMSAAGMVVMATVAPVWGALADRHGRKSMVVRALFGGGLTVALMSFARSPGQLFVLRTIQGVFSGTVSATRTLVASVAPAAELGFALGTMQTAAFIGTSIGPLLGGLIADRFGYSIAFALTGVLLVGSGIAVFLLVHESFTPPVPQPASAHGGLLGSLRLILDVPGLAALIGTLFFVQAGMGAVGPILPLFVQSLLPPGAPSVASLSGLILGATAVTSAVAAGVAGRLGDRLGHERILAVCAIGGGLLYFPQALVTSAWQLLILRAFLGIFTGGLFPGVMAIIALRSPASRRGWVFGVTATATALGNAVGPLASAWVAGAFGLRAAFLFTATALTAAGVWVALALAPRAVPPAYPARPKSDAPRPKSPATS